MSDITIASKNELEFAGKIYRCAIGANGFTDTPKEGDKATPLGTYFLRECLFRPDRLQSPHTSLPLRFIEQTDGWCDDPKSPEYNLPVKLPFSASHENLWREDHTYDVIVPIGFNDAPVTPGLGSAIFFHLARPDYSPTLGCVAVSLPDMLEILAGLDGTSRIVIAPI